MPAIGSAKNGEACDVCCGCAMLPFKTSIRGPAPKVPTGDYEDIVSEVLFLFRGDVFFANFDVKGPADRLLVVLILYVTKCLDTIKNCTTADQANRALYVLNAKKMYTPGSNGYSLNAFLFPPKDEAEKEMYHNYMSQIRTELSQRLVDLVYKEGEWSRKWWMTFLNKNFMNLKLSLI